MYKSKNHSRYSLKVHLIFATKYRKPLLADRNISFALKSYLEIIASKSNFSIELAEVDKDHIYLLVDYEPKISVLQIVRRLKQETTFRLWKKFGGQLRKYYYKEHTFWSDGYFACSIGTGASYSTIQEYNKSQG